MAEPALRGMTVAEFLDWDDGADTRYELIGGMVVAMAQPAPAHGRIAVRLGGTIDAALRARPPCFVQAKAGIVRPDRDDTCYVADLAASYAAAEAGDRLMRDQFLIVEILSPSTAGFDRQTKIADYRTIAGVEEILLTDSESMFADVLRRDGERWVTEIVQGPQAVLALASVPLSIAMTALDDGIPLPEPRPGARTAG